MKEDVFIISAVRTAIGRYGGALQTVTSGDLGSIVIKEGLKRASLSPDQIDEVILGEVRQSTESCNMARVATLRAGMPEELPAYTVNRLCASAMQAMYDGYLQVATGEINVVMAGGAENMSRGPLYIRNARWGGNQVQFIDSNLEGGPGAQPNEIYGSNLSMGMTAENVAEKYNISREDQDLFALRSQQLAISAINEGRFKEEIVPVEIKTKKKSSVFDTDEHVRPDTTLETLAGLKPVFKQGGSVTAGNSCGRNDSAAVMVLASGKAVKEFGLTPIGKLIGFSVAGVSPRYMGIGPVPAVKKLLGKLNLSLTDIDLIEINEAFASQALAGIRELGLEQNMDIINVNGGGIALGHPLGATGCRICVTLLYEMKRRGLRRGLATLCVGGGQGMAVVLETI